MTLPEKTQELAEYLQRNEFTPREIVAALYSLPGEDLADILRCIDMRQGTPTLN